MTLESIALSGSPGSPYTRKMLATLRYRRIPYRFLAGSSATAMGLPEPKVRLLPIVYFADASGAVEAVTDSTPIIRRLEREVEARSIVPADPALALLDELVEDYADEWLTKAMFHYRWSYEADIRKASRILPCWSEPRLSDERLAERGRAFAERQIGRLHVVGSNPATGPLIETSYRRFLEIFEAHLSDQPFVLGHRPASCDFALFGQLTQLVAFDPTPAAIAEELAPRVCAWVGAMEDLSGLEPDPDAWISLSAPPPTLTRLLAEIGRTYVPVMLANAEALENGDAEVSAEVEGQAWRQPPFAYQRKCLGWLRASHAALADAARRRVEPLLAEAGLARMFA